MIRSFASTDTESFFTTGKSRRFPSEILKRAAMRLNQLSAATDVKDLRLPPPTIWRRFQETARGSGAYESTNSGAFAFCLKMAMP